MSLLSSILRLALLLLMPLWLSLASQALELRWTLPSFLSGWLGSEKTVDPSLVPPAGWRESAYLTANPDIAAAVRNGTLVSGYAHYVQSGRAENRRGGFPVDNTSAILPAPAHVPAPIPIPSTSDLQPAPPSDPAAAPEAPSVRPPAAPAQPPVPTVKPAAGGMVLRIRTGNSDEAVRIVLDFDVPDRGAAPRFDPPARRPDGSLTVTLPDTGWRAPATGRLPATELTYRVEATGNASRLAVKGETPLALKGIFTLPPDSERGHRLVIDIAVPKTGKGRKPARP